MTDLLEILSADASDAQATFFAMARNDACMRAAKSVLEAQAAALKASGPAHLLAEFIQREVTSEANVLAALIAEMSRLQKQANDARIGSAALEDFYKSQRALFSKELVTAGRVALALTSDAIPQLARRIDRFDADRAAHRERLLGVGISDAEIDAADLIKPRIEDRDAWIVHLQECRARHARVDAFANSGPLFDMALLHDDDLIRPVC
ncbi:hypothetical protein [Caballeronia sp. BR00000012568055]|uniref:hypothetical protein n=1 Tax=Caballeronia sp. BR00000012568055 TaxID=2918761 RepID=UPI0023F96C6E|nr:hypothetical protein [Caballeronia sp. BR00000012568055]